MPARVLRHKQSVMNLGALAGIQLANAILPLVAYPLILGAVGAGPFSKIVVTESVTMIVLSIVLYSFDIDGVSRIADQTVRPSAERMAVVFSEVLWARLALLGVYVAALLVAAIFLPAATSALLLMWALLPLSHVLQSAWFYQGTERNLAAALIAGASRVGCLVLVKLLIHAPSDFIIAPLIIGGCYCVGGAASLAFAVIRDRLPLSRVPLRRIRELLIQGKEIPFGNLSVAMYRDSNVLILGALSTPQVVSVYYIAEKAIKVFQALARPLNQLFFPKVIRALGGMHEPNRQAFRIILRYTVPQIACLAVGEVAGVIAYVFYRDYFPAPFRSAQAHEILTLLAIMCVTVYVGVANFMFGMGGLNYLHHRRQFAKAILTTGVCSLILCVALVKLFAATGAAVSFVLAEVLLFALVIRYYRGEADNIVEAAIGVPVQQAP